jgi:Fe-S cluster assembly protein SufD
VSVAGELIVMSTEIVKQENSYLEALRARHSEITADGPTWVARLRESAMERFAELGFPSVKEEEWKYTNVAPISKLDFAKTQFVSSKVTAAEVTRLGCPEAANSQLVFVNGVLREDLSSTSELPAGVVAMNLSQALLEEEHRELIREHLARTVDYNTNGFIALNTAMISGGAFVHIPRNVELEQPLSLLFIAEADSDEVAAFPRVLVIAEESSRATIIESYAGIGEGTSFTNAVVEIDLKAGARLEHYKIQRESSAAFHVATTGANLGPNSSYDSTTINFGARLSRHDIGIKMDHEGAECWVDGLYVVSSGQHTDTHSVIDHRQPHCTSHQLYKGILDGKSRAVFNGKIFVRHGAQKTDAMQTNKNLLLSNEARVDTKPQLEILADDVKCAHGAAVGQIDEDELFYLETRGIHTELARNLLTYGFAEEVIGKIKLESIREQLDAAVLNRLNARLEA